MKSYIRNFVRGLVGVFVRQPDGKLKCLDLAVAEGPGVRKVGEPVPEPYTPSHPKLRSKGLTEKAEEANRKAVRDEFLTPTTALDPVSDERLRAMDLDALRKLYRRAIDSGDSDLASRVTQQFYRAEHESEDK